MRLRFARPLRCLLHIHCGATVKPREVREIVYDLGPDYPGKYPRSSGDPQGLL